MGIVQLESNVTAWDDFDGQILINLGRKLHKPLLSVLGMTIKKYHPCSEWTEWSQCVAHRLGYIGTKSRTRNCQRIDSYYREETEKSIEIETDVQLCVGFCPNSYTLTKHGFCVKLFTTEKSQYKADRQCQQDGGYLIKIDSDVKHEDVKDVLKGFSDYMYVNGRRKDVNSPWEFSYGTQNGYLKWVIGEPGNYSNALCLCLDKSESRLWRDVNCVSKRPFLCEVVM